MGCGKLSQACWILPGYCFRNIFSEAVSLLIDRRESFQQIFWLIVLSTLVEKFQRLFARQKRSRTGMTSKPFRAHNEAHVVTAKVLIRNACQFQSKGHREDQQPGMLHRKICM